MQNYIEIIGGILGGGSIVSFFQLWRDSKKDKTEEIFNVVEQYKGLIEQHKITIAEMKVTETKCKEILDRHDTIINDMRNIIGDLRNKIAQLEASNNDFPFPTWFKDMDLTMVWINPAYEELILKPNGKKESDYIGKTDIEVWGEEIGKSYQATDRKSMKYKGGMVMDEEVVFINGADMSSEWKVIKWVRYLGRTPIGYAGAALPILHK